MKKIKTGIILMLIGAGFPIILAFFQDDGYLFKIAAKKTDKTAELGYNTLRSLDNYQTEYDRALTKMQETARSELRRYNELKAKGENPELPSLAPGFIFNDMEELMSAGESLKKDIIKLRNEYLLINEMNFFIPYKYSIGAGIIIFFFGLGFIIPAIIDRKGRAS